MDRIDSRSTSHSELENGDRLVWGPPLDPSAPTRLDHIPKEVGALLLITGIITGMLPPPPGPIDLSLVAAGGVSLWPRGFQAIDGWMRRRFPGAHRTGMIFLDRYLDDLERRYPGSTNAAKCKRVAITRMLGDLARDGPVPGS